MKSKELFMEEMESLVNQWADDEFQYENWKDEKLLELEEA